MKCPICENNSTFNSVAIKLNYGGIYTCYFCKSGIMLPRPSSEDLINLHSTKSYFEHSYFDKKRKNTEYPYKKISSKVELICQKIGSIRGKKILEVGCDTGIFLQCLRKVHYADVTGVDVSRLAIEVAQSSGLNVFHGTLEQARFPSESYDIIFAFDLFEHVANPVSFLREVQRILKKGGIIIIETPNYNGLIYRIGRLFGRLHILQQTMQAMQERLWPPFHVQYFTRRSLSNILKSNHLQPVKLKWINLTGADLAVDNKFIRLMILLVFKFSVLLNSHTIIFAIGVKD